MTFGLFAADSWQCFGWFSHDSILKTISLFTIGHSFVDMKKNAGFLQKQGNASVEGYFGNESVSESWPINIGNICACAKSWHKVVEKYHPYHP